jgi:hypothetical protein
MVVAASLQHGCPLLVLKTSGGFISSCALMRSLQDDVDVVCSTHKLDMLVVEARQPEPHQCGICTAHLLVEWLCICNECYRCAHDQRM